MKNTKVLTPLILGAVLLVLFAGLTAALKIVDVQVIGPMSTVIGLAGINGPAAEMLGYRPLLYEITEGLGKPVLLFPAGFALCGLVQLIRGRSLKAVDSDLYLLAVLYLALAAAYVFFEKCVINYRPVLLTQEVEASFPSSHTMLAVVILGSAVCRFRWHMRNEAARAALSAGCIALMAVLVAGRLFSGVHWVTDILGGLLLSGALLSLYIAAVRLIHLRRDN